MKLIVILAFLFSSISGCVFGADLILKEGDCWSYDTRVGEEDSFIVIRKIESVPQLGEVVHISIFDIKVKSAFSPSGFSPSVLLQPFSGGPLRASLKQRITREIPTGDWKFAFQSLNEKRGGHPTIPVTCIDKRVPHRSGKNDPAHVVSCRARWRPCVDSPGHSLESGGGQTTALQLDDGEGPRR